MSFQARPRKRLARVEKMLVITFLPALLQGVAITRRVEAVSPPTPPSQVQLEGLTSEQSREVNDVLGLFSVARLNLPPVLVRASREDAICNGHDGLYKTHGQTAVISICTSKTGGRERHVILHEFAHAWITHEVSAERRAEFQSLRGWGYWLDYTNADWRDNGFEQAAEIIAWGLNDQIAPAVAIDGRTCAELRAGYVALTGSPPLHGLTKICSGPTKRTIS